MGAPTTPIRKGGRPPRWANRSADCPCGHRSVVPENRHVVYCPPFGRDFFVERNPEHAKALGELRDEFPDLADRISVADANDFLQSWCQQTAWRTNRAVVFLDPYGMQVDWSTIEAIAATKAINLWILFPLGQAVNRLLTRNHIPEGG